MTSAPDTPTDPTAPADVVPRLRTAAPYLVLALMSVVAGGLVAAVTAHAPSEHPVWASAYLVLVTGVAQTGLALGRVLLAPARPRPGTVHRDLGAWTLGNVAVLVGTLADTVALVDVGGALLVIALALCVWAVRGHAATTRHRSLLWLPWLYRFVVVVLLVSIPTGLLLARR